MRGRDTRAGPQLWSHNNFSLKEKDLTATYFTENICQPIHLFLWMDVQLSWLNSWNVYVILTHETTECSTVISGTGQLWHGRGHRPLVLCWNDPVIMWTVGLCVCARAGQRGWWTPVITSCSMTSRPNCDRRLSQWPVVPRGKLPWWVLCAVLQTRCFKRNARVAIIY